MDSTDYYCTYVSSLEVSFGGKFYDRVIKGAAWLPASVATLATAAAAKSCATLAAQATGEQAVAAKTWMRTKR